MIKRWKETLAIIITVSFFVVVSFLTNKYGDSLRLVVGSVDTYIGVIIYFIVSIFAFVFAPLNSVALVPVAVSLWGPLNAGIVVHLAGTVGCVITYALSSTYGLPFVKRFISDDDIYKYQKFIPTKNKFATLVVLNVFLPGDILGYVLGIFLKISYPAYALAFFIGNLPFTFGIIFATTLGWQYQLLLGFILALAVFFGVTKIGEKISIRKGRGLVK